MTDLIDRADSGEIPSLPGETRIRIDPGEITRNIGPYSEFARPIRRPDALDAPTVLIEVPLGLSFIDLAAAQPVSPWERVIDIESTVVYRLDGELRPAAPGPRPTGPLPPNPPPQKGYTGRHRLSWGGRVRRLLAGAGVVGLAVVAIWAGLILAAVAVFL